MSPFVHQRSGGRLCNGTFTLFRILATEMIAQAGRRSVVGMLARARMAKVEVWYDEPPSAAYRLLLAGPPLAITRGRMALP